MEVCVVSPIVLFLQNGRMQQITKYNLRIKIAAHRGAIAVAIVIALVIAIAKGRRVGGSHLNPYH